MTLFIASILLALVVSALCSLMEAALLSLTPGQVAEMGERYPRRGAIWRGFKSGIERPIAVILLLNTAAHTIGASVAGAEFDALYGDRYIWAFSLAFTFVMLQYTEILPKSLGVRFNRELALLIAVPLEILIRLLTPFIRVIHWLNRPFEGRRRDGAESPATLDEIRSLAALARISNLIGAHQERIIEGAARLSRTPVRDAMIPVDQVAFLSTGQSLNEALIAAHLDAHTRFPVCEGGDRDRVAGYLNFKELVFNLRTNPGMPTVAGIVRPVHFVAPDTSCSDLLRTFVDEHIHVAVVRDAAGRTLGLVTWEDLIEELVGKREDEFDRLPHHVHALAGGVWMAGGGVPMAELEAALRAPLGGGTETLAAWLGARLGGAPRPNQACRHAGHEFTVRRVRRGKVFEASARRVGEGPGDGSGAKAP
jgi:CBS domain containing-hemolysin-like protein